MPSTIRQLLKLITDSIDKLEASCEASGHQLPDLHDSFSIQSEAFRTGSGVEEATRIVCAAAMQLEATLMPPSLSFYRLVTGVSRAISYHVGS